MSNPANKLPLEPSASALRAPALRRRLAAFVYEGLLLFGVLMAAGLVYAVLTDQRHALKGSHGLQAFLFIVLGLYFVGFWVHQGQTLAMRTWRMQLVGPDGRRVSWKRAACRYVLAWLWFLPALGALSLTGLQGGGPALGAISVGVLTYAMLTFVHPQRQFLHDVLCNTRLVPWKPQARPDDPAA
jgi:uncharacterized RDD family membrane protein YckC